MNQAEPDWALVDRMILEGHSVPAIKAIKDRDGCGLEKAIDAYHHRAATLRAPHSGPQPPEADFGSGADHR